MTDQQHPIPPDELMQQWVTNAHDIGAPPGTCPNTRKIILPAINWGWQQRGAVNEAELQKARDEELEACCAGIRTFYSQDWLRLMRRPEPKSQAEEALNLLNDASGRLDAAHENVIRRALERLRELEGGND